MKIKTYKVAPTHGARLWSRKTPVIPIPLQLVTMATLQKLDIYGCFHLKVLNFA